MTQPDREELAGRLDEHARRYERSALMAENRAKRRTDSFRAANERGQAKLFRSRAADMKAAAASLRQSPSVEEVETVLSSSLRAVETAAGPTVIGLGHAAQAIDRLYRGRKE